MSCEIGQESYCSMVAEAFDGGNAGESRQGHGMKRGQRQTLRKNTRDPEDRIIKPQFPEVVQEFVQSLETTLGPGDPSQQSTRKAHVPVHAVEDLQHRQSSGSHAFKRNSQDSIPLLPLPPATCWSQSLADVYSNAKYWTPRNGISQTSNYLPISLTNSHIHQMLLSKSVHLNL